MNKSTFKKKRWKEPTCPAQTNGYTKAGVFSRHDEDGPQTPAEDQRTPEQVTPHAVLWNTQSQTSMRAR